MSQCGQFGRYQNPGFPFDGSSDQAIRPEASPNGGFPEVKIGSHNICFSFSGCFVVLGWVGPSGSPGRLSHFGQTSFTTGLASLKYDRGKLYQGIHDPKKNGRGLRKFLDRRIGCKQEKNNMADRRWCRPCNAESEDLAFRESLACSRPVTAKVWNIKTTVDLALNTIRHCLRFVSVFLAFPWKITSHKGSREKDLFIR